MKNKDIVNQVKTEIMQKMNTAIQAGDNEAFASAFDEFCNFIQEKVLEEAKGLTQAADTNVLVSRGVRQLTSEEKTYYEHVIEAMKSSNPKQALTELSDVLPKTTIDSVFEDLQTNHDLLNEISFTNTAGLVEILVNTNGVELATWGTLTSEITKELTSGFDKINLTLNKLSAFLPVSKSMLDLGPQWLDKYVRTVLAEALANGLEKSIIDGTGKDQPIGMNRQVGDNVTVVAGVYPIKETVTVNSLDPITYGNLLASLAVGPNNKVRKVDHVIMIVNPVDYLQKVMPATTIRSSDGTYVNNILPFPTKVIQSIHVESGKAIIGLPKRYFMGIGTAKNGKIEYDDSVRFLEDERVYLVKLYGHGEPLDDNAFIYCDISGLTVTPQQVFVTNASHTVVVNNTEDNPIPVTPSYDARLYSLKIGNLSLTPLFNKSTHSYTLTTSNATNTITAVAVDAEAGITITNGYTEITNGSTATWVEGTNTVTVTVVNGTETETYTVVVTYTTV